MLEQARDGEDVPRGLVAEPEAGVWNGAPRRPEASSIRLRQGPWRDMLRRRMLLAADAAAIAIAIASLTALGLIEGDQTGWLFSLLPLWLVAAKLTGLYDRDHRCMRHLTTDELPRLLSWTTVGVAASALLLAWTDAGALPSGVAIAMWIAVALMASILRAVARRGWRRVTPPERTILIGSGAVEAATRRKLELFPDIHMEIVGSLPIDGVVTGRDVAARLGRLAIENAPIDGVVLASQSIGEDLIAALVAYCRQARIKLRMTPPARTMFGTAAQLGHVADLPILAYTTWDVSRTTLLIKRAIDVAGATIGLVVLAPLMLTIAVAIKLSDGGSVLFLQQRAGKGAARFTMLKFRTMVVDAEARLTTLLSIDELEEPAFKFSLDPRVTRVGRVLRRWSLDELPQLLNVLLGQMSLVGPRPEELAVVERYTPEQRIRLALRPGLTGPMQVYGRGALLFYERLAVEREYIENFSLGGDLRIGAY
jgi:exopolysaccharide biosynthesis polyprenyl glycosylphosphotransferase